MGKRLPTTPRGWVKMYLSKMFNHSRERAAAIKREHGCCQDCGAKGRPKATRNGPECKIQVHHLDGSHRDEIVNEVFKWLLCNPDRLRVLCVPCHDKVDGNVRTPKGKVSNSCGSAKDAPKCS